MQLLIVSSACTISLLCVIIFRYILQIKWMRAVHIMTKFDTIWNSKLKWGMLFEICICLITSYPFFIDIWITQNVEDYAVTIFYELNHFLLVISFIWIYIFVRYLLVSSKYMNARAYRVSILNGCNANYYFALKCLMKEKPLTL